MGAGTCSCRKGRKNKFRSRCIIFYLKPGKFDENNPDGATYLISNLNSAVKNAVAKTGQTGYSNETLYGNLHVIIRPYVDKKTNSCMWNDKNTKSSLIQAVIKYRWGVLWNSRTAQRPTDGHEIWAMGL